MRKTHSLLFLIFSLVFILANILDLLCRLFFLASSLNFPCRATQRRRLVINKLRAFPHAHSSLIHTHVQNFLHTRRAGFFLLSLRVLSLVYHKVSERRAILLLQCQILNFAPREKQIPDFPGGGAIIAEINPRTAQELCVQPDIHTIFYEYSVSNAIIRRTTCAVRGGHKTTHAGFFSPVVI